MKRSLVPVLCAAMVGFLAFSAPVMAKSAKECQKEWRANKAANQANKITEKAYVATCKTASSATESKSKKAAEKKKASKEKEKKTEKTTTKEKAAKEKTTKSKKTEKTSAAGGGKKTVKECRAEWRANKAANKAKKISEKAYVETCRSSTAATEPKTMAAPSSNTEKATTKKETTKKEKETSRPMTPTKTTHETHAGSPAGADQYASESQAKARCPRDTIIWANLDSKIYHFAGHNDYGNTKSGAYMCEKDAMKQGMRAAKNEKHP